MTDDLEEVLASVRDRIAPEESERRRLREVTARVIDRTKRAATELPVEADVIQVGSTARDTWLRGERDIDVFVRFPPDLNRESLERYGLSVGRSVLQDGHEEYAEHPYVSGEFEGFAVDLVPCYRVAAATEIRSAVDRTPFHTRYVEAALDDRLAGEVRLAKQFCSGIGVYGSNLRTRGFSGYLLELLVLEYDGFEPLLEAAADWHPPVRIDPEDHGTKTFDDPLIVIDPTDPARNVAAALSERNFSRFQHHARALRSHPTTERFFPDEPAPLSEAALRDHLARRATTPVAIRFDPPAIVDDQLYPQLTKSIEGVSSALTRQGFSVIRAATFVEETAVLFIEVNAPTLPAIERHVGPPVHVREHAEGFYESYAEGAVYGPFIEGDRYVVERRREHTSVRGLLESDALFDAALGAHVENALEEGYEVLVGEEVTKLASEFGVELARYFDPRP